MKCWSVYRRTAAVVACAIGALVAGACAPIPPPPPLGALPTVIPYAGSSCLKVLVVGDSIADGVAERLEQVLTSSGRCAHVSNRAVSGSGVVDWVPGGLFDVRTRLATVKPDVVFAFFVGNESFSGLRWTDPSWLAKTAAAARTIVDQVPTGIPIYWAIPTKVAWQCEWGSLNDQQWVWWHAWVHTILATERPSVRLVDWRATFGGETFHRAFTFADGIARDVYTSDCVHFSAAGADVATLLVVAAMQGEWVTAPPVTATSTTTTTAPPASSTTSSTSTSSTSTSSTTSP